MPRGCYEDKCKSPWIKMVTQQKCVSVDKIHLNGLELLVKWIYKKGQTYRGCFNLCEDFEILVIS